MHPTMSTQSGAFLKPIRTTPPVAAAPAAYRHIRSDVGRTRYICCCYPSVRDPMYAINSIGVLDQIKI
ncbi:hypothetical protein RHMOL_Rhmol02G0155900 [Rhododendron molle]|uniref:Uncharacterized protein n=2 Tax=Rhododendron molle TaxID=49168 RepID=A0ACC0MS95_RHOML|nr:hypothetical protein RHMOL_RhmolUnG0004300 [Rhododendron molle]KAI8543173.1 hypothetical protein RHMOL_Rhmol08G0197100 [Rhododendron molle]KAI8567882.1 hypothetical protein RHMOL_Rhmol02G0155900 [Rhododendron molle]